MKKTILLVLVIIAITIAAITIFYDRSKKSPYPCVPVRPHRIYFNDFTYDFEFLRVLGGAPTGYADIQECFITANSITENNDESWYEAWEKTAERLKTIGEQFLADV